MNPKLFIFKKKQDWKGFQSPKMRRITVGYNDFKKYLTELKLGLSGMNYSFKKAHHRREQNPWITYSAIIGSSCLDTFVSSSI